MALDTFTADPYVGEARKFDITMQFTAGEIYGPSTLEVLTAVNDTALLSICKVEIAKVGKGLGCYDQKVQNESFVYTARYCLLMSKLLISVTFHYVVITVTHSCGLLY